VFAEDLSQVRTGHGPQVMATLRNLAVSLHRITGATNIATSAATPTASYRSSDNDKINFAETLE